MKAQGSWAPKLAEGRSNTFKVKSVKVDSGKSTGSLKNLFRGVRMTHSGNPPTAEEQAAIENIQRLEAQRKSSQTLAPPGQDPSGWFNIWSKGHSQEQIPTPRQQPPVAGQEQWAERSLGLTSTGV